MKHPIQPLEIDDHGVIRFKQNKIIGYLFESGKLSLNDIACMPFDQNDREQLWQLLGYSLSGYGDLSFVSDETYNAARLMFDENVVDSRDARIASLEHELFMIRSTLKGPIARLYGIAPEDLGEQ